LAWKKVFTEGLHRRSSPKVLVKTFEDLHRLRREGLHGYGVPSGNIGNDRNRRSSQKLFQNVPEHSGKNELWSARRVVERALDVERRLAQLLPCCRRREAGLTIRVLLEDAPDG
jgi:hypothetical protein